MDVALLQVIFFTFLELSGSEAAPPDALAARPAPSARVELLVFDPTTA